MPVTIANTAFVHCALLNTHLHCHLIGKASSKLLLQTRKLSLAEAMEPNHREGVRIFVVQNLTPALFHICILPTI